MSNNFISIETFQAETAATRATIKEMLRSPDGHVNWDKVKADALEKVSHHGDNLPASKQHIQNVITEFHDAYSSKDKINP